MWCEGFARDAWSGATAGINRRFITRTETWALFPGQKRVSGFVNHRFTPKMDMLQANSQKKTREIGK